MGIYNSLPEKKYRILKTIGKGAFGTIFMVEEKKTRKIFAMKEVNFFNLKEKKGTLKELLILRYLKNSVGPKMKEAFISRHQIISTKPYLLGCTYIIEYFNCDLRHFLKIKSLSFSEMKRLMAELIQDLMFLHFNGIIHRDLKPDNVLIKSDKISICDFNVIDTFHCEQNIWINDTRLRNNENLDFYEEVSFFDDGFIEENKGSYLNENFSKRNLINKKEKKKKNFWKEKENYKKNEIFHFIEKKYFNSKIGQNLIIENFEKVTKCIDQTIFCGTQSYLSPENILFENYNEKSDIWSLGCIFLELALNVFGEKNQKIFKSNKISCFQKISNCLRKNINKNIKDIIIERDEQIFKILEAVAYDGNFEHFDFIQKNPYFKMMLQNHNLNFEKNGIFHQILKYFENKKDFCDLIKKMLCFNPKNRLNIFEICSHKFFENNIFNEFVKEKSNKYIYKILDSLKNIFFNNIIVMLFIYEMNFYNKIKRKYYDIAFKYLKDYDYDIEYF